MKKLNFSILMLTALIFITSMVSAQMEESPYPDIIWNNIPLMYFIDFVIIISAILAFYFGSQMLSGELKRVFMYVFVGVILIAFNYVLDAFSMLIGNMGLMRFFHLNIFWILNAVAFILITFGFYKMNKLFKQVGGGAFLKRIKSNRKIRKNALK